MTTHEGFLDLAAAAIDFDLPDRDLADLELHLADCDACRRAAAAFLDDAATIASGPRPHLSPERSAKILTAVLRPRQRPSPMRLLAVAAVIAVVGAGTIMVGAGWRLSLDPLLVVVPSAGPGPSATSGASAGPTVAPSTTAGPTTRSSDEAPTPTEPSALLALPVRGSGQEFGTAVRMAPAARDGLYVSIPATAGTVLALLDPRGRPRDGWPIVIPDTASCDLLLPADDGSIRVICTLLAPSGSAPAPIAAFAYDLTGASMPGWPVTLGDHGADGYLAARVIDDQLAIYAWATNGSNVVGEPNGSGWIIAVAADGTVRNGTSNARLDVQDGLWAIGPDGVAYGVIHHADDDPFAPTRWSELEAMGFAGVPAGFPRSYGSRDAERIRIEGIASRPAFASDPSVGAGGHIRMIVASDVGGPARLAAYATDGVTAVDTEYELGFVATAECVGIEGTCEVPAPPLVGPDGTTFAVATYPDRTTAAAVGVGDLQTLDGWPYASDAGHQGIGACPDGAACDAFALAAPALGPDNVVYVINSASGPSVGGSLVAIGPNGALVDGWPVGLTRPGAAFWSVVVGPDGTAYALAIEPEAGGSSSATILAIAPDSTVRYVTAAIEP